ncbi:hypothetical protein, partial [Providencia alcalifaciens]|uniref:hypothetical protein n=1 Tax=Providencia alcalifaciens TaxID=126385 RepID=UPI002AA0E073
MDTSYSENWEFLLKLLNNDSEKALHDNGNFFEHQQAYALALFLANATLATPELNRCNVAELIAGKLPWPSSEGTTIFPGTQYSLAFFEAGGFISFPGGWVAVHCNEPQQTNQFDQSIEDILRVTNLLRNISFGRKGYVQPHFVIEETKLTALFNKELGITQLERILPCAVKQGGMVNAYPERHQFTQLESTYLWQCLLKRYSSEQAFRQWMLCIRTLSHYVIPVQFSLLERNETDQFLHQVELLVKEAPEFSYPLRTIYKQSINSYDFARLIQPVTLKINLHPNSDNNMADKTDEPAPLISVTAENLDGAYDIPDIDDLSDIIALGQWQYRGNWHDPMGGLSRLINSCFNYVITIDHNSLSAKSFAFNLLSLAESHQALKYMLFIGFPLSINCKYLLFLLSRPQTCEIAIYHLTNREFLLPLIRRHDVSGDLSQLYLEALVEEYVRTIDNSSNNGINLFKVSLY